MKRTLPVLAIFLGAGCIQRIGPRDEDTESTGQVDTESTGDTDTAPGGDTQHTGDTSEGTEEPELHEIPVAIVSDGANERLVVIRLDTAEMLYELHFDEVHPEICEGDPSHTCVGFGVEPYVDEETGEDLLLYTFQVFDEDPSDGYLFVPSTIVMTRLTEAGPEKLWELSSYDFETHYAGRDEICRQESACSSYEDDWSEWRGCNTHDVHKVHIVEETEQEVSLWLTDTALPTRLVRVELSKDQTCGVVTDILSSETVEGWDHYWSNNHVDTVDMDGEQMLLANFRDTSPTRPGGASGNGVNSLWAEGESGWERRWQYPGGDDDADATLNAPHNADIHSEDGTWYMVYAHSNGMGAHRESEGWTMEDDHAGSIGVARFDADTVTYLFEGVVEDPGFNFLRDVDRIADDSWLVTDSGCSTTVDATCERDPGLRHVQMRLDQADPVEGRDGRWSADHSTQNVVTLTELDGLWESPLDCGLNTPYEADFRWADELGSFLRGRLEDPVDTCENQNRRGGAQ